MRRLPLPALAVVVALSGLLAVLSARAELVIEISRGAERPMPVAIVPLGWQGDVLMDPEANKKAPCPFDAE